MSVDFIEVELRRDEFHRSIGGGIPRESLMLIEGKYGHGKSILCQRIAYAALKHDCTVTYISNELSTKDFLKQMDSVEYSVDDFMINGKLLFIPMFPLLGNVVFQSDLIQRLMGAKKLFESDLVIIDTLSFLLVKDNATESECFDVIKFFKIMANLDTSILFTVDSETVNPSLLGLIRSMCDIHFELNQKIFAGDVKRMITVNRFKRAKSKPTQIIPFRVETKQGLSIAISSVV